jgi:RHS repeat-associated protein
LPTTFKFTGQRQESSLGGAEGLYYYGARWYDPALGRFAQADSIIPEATQGAQAWDRYAYANNNALKYTDPTGHGVLDFLIKLVGGEQAVKNGAMQLTGNDPSLYAGWDACFNATPRGKVIAFALVVEEIPIKLGTETAPYSLGKGGADKDRRVIVSPTNAGPFSTIETAADIANEGFHMVGPYANAWYSQLEEYTAEYVGWEVAKSLLPEGVNYYPSFDGYPNPFERTPTEEELRSFFADKPAKYQGYPPYPSDSPPDRPIEDLKTPIPQ